MSAGAPDLSAGARVRQSGLVRAFAFEAVDQTQGLAPIRDAALGDQAETRVAGARADQRLHRPKQLVCCVGDGRASGALAILRQSLSMDSVLDMPLTGVTGRGHGMGLCAEMDARGTGCMWCKQRAPVSACPCRRVGHSSLGRQAEHASGRPRSVAWVR